MGGVLEIGNSCEAEISIYSMAVGSIEAATGAMFQHDVGQS